VRRPVKPGLRADESETFYQKVEEEKISHRKSSNLHQVEEPSRVLLQLRV